MTRREDDDAPDHPSGQSIAQFCCENEHASSSIVEPRDARPGRSPRRAPESPEKVSEPLHRLRRLHLAQFAHPARHPPSNVRPEPLREERRRRFPVAQPAKVKPLVVVRTRRTRARANLPRDSWRRGRDANVVTVVVPVVVLAAARARVVLFTLASRSFAESPSIRPQPRVRVRRERRERIRLDPQDGEERSRWYALVKIERGDHHRVDAPPSGVRSPSAATSTVTRARSSSNSNRRRTRTSLRVLPLGSGSRPTNAGSSDSLVWSIPSTTGQSSRGEGFDSVDSGVGSPGRGNPRASARSASRSATMAAAPTYRGMSGSDPRRTSKSRAASSTSSRPCANQVSTQDTAK